jgi:hypothetical protein
MYKLYKFIFYSISIILVVLFGYYIDIMYPLKENYNNETVKRCYDKIVKRNSKYYMFNSKSPLENNYNPLVFDNLEDYATWNRRKSLQLGYDCPFLYYSGKDDDYIHAEEEIHPVSKTNIKNENDKPIVKINKIYNPEIISKPYATDTILNLDGYEYDRVFGFHHMSNNTPEKDREIETLQNDPRVPHSVYEYNPISNDTYNSIEVQSLTDEELKYEEMLKQPLPDENRIVEESIESIKMKYLEEHPEYSDVKIKRTGYNQYEVEEVTPTRATNEEWETNIINRIDENEITPEDLQSYGEMNVDLYHLKKNNGHLRYLTHADLFDETELNGAVQRMFAPTLPREIWYQKESE